MHLEVDIYRVERPRIQPVPYPKKAKPGDAGFDLMAHIEDSLIILPGDATLIPTGIRIHINSDDVFGAIYPRSGLGHKEGLVLGNGTGIIDSGYTGEVKVSLLNRSSSSKVIHPYDRIAQLVFQRHVRVEWTPVDELALTDRGDGGFGHTGC